METMIHPGDGSGSHIAWWPRWVSSPFYTGIQGFGCPGGGCVSAPMGDVSQGTKIGTGIIVVAGIATMIGMLWSAARSVEHNRRSR